MPRDMHSGLPPAPTVTRYQPGADENTWATGPRTRGTAAKILPVEYDMIMDRLTPPLRLTLLSIVPPSEIFWEERRRLSQAFLSITRCVSSHTHASALKLAWLPAGSS